MEEASETDIIDELMKRKDAKTTGSDLAGSYRDRKVLITGGLGFLGSNLAHKLVRLGAQVTLLDCLLPSHGGNPFNIDGIERQAQWVKGDIRDAGLLEKILKDQEFLFNIAAQTSHTDSMRNPVLDAEINTMGQIKLLEACRKVAPEIRIVYCSTRAIYGSSEDRARNEKGLPNPLDIYSADKLAGEHYHRIYAAVHGLNATILRVANGYGPRAQMKEPSFGILNWFIRLAIDDETIKIFGNGKQVRDYAHVDDIVRSFLMVGQRRDLRGETFNVGSGEGLPLITIVKQVLSIAGKGRIMHVPWPETNKKIDVGDFIADVRKIRKTVGWRAQTTMRDGLRSTVDFYQRHRKRYW